MIGCRKEALVWGFVMDGLSRFRINSLFNMQNLLLGEPESLMTFATLMTLVFSDSGSQPVNMVPSILPATASAHSQPEHN